MIEIFKTNLSNKTAARELVTELEHCFPGLKANVDLEDCDRILRICFGKSGASVMDIIRFAGQKNYETELIPDNAVMMVTGHTINII